MPTFKGYDINASEDDDLIYALKDPAEAGTTYTIRANGGNDKIYGPYQNETAGGVRQIFAGSGDDSIYLRSTPFRSQAGLTIDGGDGFDRLYLRDDKSGLFDLTKASISSVEYIYFAHDLTMKLTDLVGADGRNKVTLKIGGEDTDQLTLALDNIHSTATIDLSKFLIRGFGPDHVLQTGNAINSGLPAGGGAALFVGSRYNDSFYANNAAAKVYGGLGDDRLIGRGLLSGGDGDDTLIYDSTTVPATVTMRGGTGNDALTWGSAASGFIHGGDGDDTYFGVWSIGVKVVEQAGGGTDTIIIRDDFTLPENFENLTLFLDGTALTLTGNDAGNIITNGTGGGPNDHGVTIDGKGGSDTLVGSLLKRDTFAFSTALGPDNVDTISGFTSRATKPSWSDTITLDHNVFSALNMGVLSADAFCAGATAQDADDRIIWDSATRTLYYDADGTGATEQIAFAKLTTAALIADDIRVI